MSEGPERGCGERRVDAMREFQEQHADTHTLRCDAVGLCLWNFEDQAFGAQFGQVVAKLSQAVCGCRHAESCGGCLMQVARSRTSSACEMNEAGECLHDGQEARIVQFQP